MLDKIMYLLREHQCCDMSGVPLNRPDHVQSKGISMPRDISRVLSNTG
jgi:hypothetical protein